MALKIRRGTNAERAVVTFAEGELVYVIDTDELYIGDGSTLGGLRVAGTALSSIGSMLDADTINDELDLQRNLNLSGNNIIGTGNINITGDVHASGNITAGGNIDIGDNPSDTLTILAQVDSNITPKSDTTYDIGSPSARWNNGYFTGLVVDGQIDAVAINADVVADNSTVMVDVSANTLTGNLTGDVTGNLSGNVTGNVSGNVTGNVTGDVVGNVEGDLVGSVFADNSTTLVDGVAGVLRGDHIGTLTGNVKAPNGLTVLNAGTNGLDASIVATVVGNVQGNVQGNVTGNLIGNSTGFHTGDVKGSVFADNSTVLVDAVAGVVPGAVISGTVTADLVGNVQGNVTGTLTGNIFTSLIDSADSSAITITPSVLFSSDVQVENTLTVGFSLDEGQTIIFKDGVVTANLGADTVPLTVKAASTDFEKAVEVYGELSTRTGLVVSGVGTSGFLAVQTFNGDINNQGDIDNPALYDLYAFVGEEEGTGIKKAQFGIPVVFPSFTTTERNALTAEVGMVIFNTTDTKLQVCTVGGGTPTWVDLH